jgi:hypothetical protein
VICWHFDSFVGQSAGQGLYQQKPIPTNPDTNISKDATMPLTDALIKNAKPADKPRKLSDEKGLFLLVHPNGGKYWRVAYRFDGKQKTLAVGRYPDIGLADARDRRDDARKLLANGVDPSEEKKAGKVAKQAAIEAAAAAEKNTLLQVATDWHVVWRTHVAESASKEIWRNLERNIFPDLGAVQVKDIGTKDLIDSLRKIEAAGHGATLHKARHAISLIFK